MVIGRVAFCGWWRIIAFELVLLQKHHAIAAAAAATTSSALTSFQYSEGGGGDQCAPSQFQCMHLNLNQILSINDWNRRPRECIPQGYRCDGRHDCQDGSDEVECFVQLPRKKNFRCFVGDDVEMTVEDCLGRDRANPVKDPRETSRSLSEMKEWVCSKIERPDGRVERDCLRLYTGGTLFRVCYTNSADGSTCLCSAELCNGGAVAVALPPLAAQLVALASIRAAALWFSLK